MIALNIMYLNLVNLYSVCSLLYIFYINNLVLLFKYEFFVLCYLCLRNKNYVKTLRQFMKSTVENMFFRRSISSAMSDDEHESWDAPLRRQTVPWANKNVHTRGI